MEGLALFYLTPPAALFAWLAVIVARKLRLMPSGVPTALSICLVASTMLGGVFLLVTVDALILSPAHFQNRLFGRQIAGPLSLKHYEFYGFQDVGQSWTFAYTDAQRRTLRCLPRRDVLDRACVLAEIYDQKEEWSVTASVEADRLVLEYNTW